MQKILSILLLIMLTIVSFGCAKEIKENRLNNYYVKVYEVHDEVTSEIRSFPGTVKESKFSDLAFRIAGPIADIKVKEGDYISKGQVLATMDTRDYQLQYEATKSKYQQVKSEVTRIELLYNKGNVSENDYEKAISGLEMMTAKYQQAENSLNDTKLKASYSGYIQEIYFEQGEIVNAGTPVLSIISVDSYLVECDIPAVLYAQRENFLNYKCEIETVPNADLDLTLKGIRRKANMNSLYHASFKLNAEKSTIIAPGMDVMVNIEYKLNNSQMKDSPEVLKIPIESIIEEGENNYVWILSANSTVSKREIEVLDLDGTGKVLVLKGLNKGDKIISAGIYELKENQRVNPIKEIKSSNYGELL
ncbi:MAG: hypothetical protein B6226_04190 [Candidatus Cloacimonetes bacterium 4572_65]|nr:MAG: hypothetical protein B6226_04190 [Candidatus Cloacimonetes bacterium 4572_65]